MAALGLMCCSGEKSLDLTNSECIRASDGKLGFVLSVSDLRHTISGPMFGQDRCSDSLRFSLNTEHSGFVLSLVNHVN